MVFLREVYISMLQKFVITFPIINPPKQADFSPDREIVFGPKQKKQKAFNPLKFKDLKAFLLWQREKDSNPHIRSQSPLCYLYTIPLYCTRYGGHASYYIMQTKIVKGKTHDITYFPQQKYTP